MVGRSPSITGTAVGFLAFIAQHRRGVMADGRRNTRSIVDRVLRTHRRDREASDRERWQKTAESDEAVFENFIRE